MSVTAGRRRWVVLVVLCLGQFMSLLDTTAVNVSLPSIQHELHMSAVSLSWVTNAYLITFGACLLVAGRLGDLIGRKDVFLVGLAIFLVASLLCGLAEDEAMLVISRFVQGLGAAAECAMILGIIVSIFPVAGGRNKAIGVYSFLSAAGGAIGLLLGGVITAGIGWHWIFFINLPVGAVALVVGASMIDRHRGLGLAGGVDITGGVVVTAAALLAVTGFVEAGNRGWSAPITIATLVGAVVAAVFFVVLESRLTNPLMPMRVLRSRNLVCASICRGSYCFGSYGSFFLLVLYLQEILGYGPLGNGLAFLPNSVFLSVMALTITPWLMARIGPRAMHTTGLIGFAVGLVLLVGLPVHGGFWADLLPAMVVLGASGGTYGVPNVSLAMAESEATDSGLVSGVINVSQQLGAAMGVAVLASVSATRTRSLEAAGVAHRVAIVRGFHEGFVVAICALGVGVVSSLLVRVAKASPAAVALVSSEG